MPNLISQETYDETIKLIEGKKSPDSILMGMREFYKNHGIFLYNYIMKITLKTVKYVVMRYVHLRMLLKII